MSCYSGVSPVARWRLVLLRISVSRRGAFHRCCLWSCGLLPCRGRLRAARDSSTVGIEKGLRKGMKMVSALLSRCCSGKPQHHHAFFWPLAISHAPLKFGKIHAWECEYVWQNMSMEILFRTHWRHRLNICVYEYTTNLWRFSLCIYFYKPSTFCQESFKFTGERGTKAWNYFHFPCEALFSQLLWNKAQSMK